MWQTLDGPTFYGLLARLPYYEGVVMYRIKERHAPQDGPVEVEVGDAAVADYFEVSTV